MKKYLVTGGAGFIGSHLCDYLLGEGHKVVVVDNFNDYYDVRIKERNVGDNLDNPNYKLYRGDIRDLDFLKNIFQDEKLDAVINLAAMAGVRPSLENPILYEEVNVRGLMNLLELSKANGINKFIQASSSSVYGNNKEVPFKETAVVDYAISPYAATKKAGEVMGHVYHHLYNIDMIQLRFFTVYGPRQRPDLAIHKFTRMIAAGEMIPFYGDGTTQRDYTYIDDIIDGVVKSIKYLEKNEKVYEIFNLGESHTVTLKEMVETIEKELGIEAKINRQPMQPGDVEKTYADISKAKKVLGYAPKTQFSEGIKKFLTWYNGMNIK
ncbi:GDP-mannose 4,6-dehydratase [uncultured Ilyobacter sp.]|uniref:GDP-mannose 4,6-dehydratase n=1 Tax=uncultured Ilyobacter sp. TaxID=544433 RepID=UPI0029C6D153|nr:GDP-mannose 4,6-dehydratase [uncultured Ilyobacter sp.]